jgi:hypothetical protein
VCAISNVRTARYRMPIYSATYIGLGVPPHS